MKITTRELCETLDIPEHRLYRRCSTHTGNHFTWLTREIMLNEWHGIGFDGQKYMTELLKVLVNTPKSRGGQILGDLINNKLIAYSIPYINALAHVHAQRSPFVTHKRKK